MDNPPPPNESIGYRNILALAVLIASVTGISLLSITIIWKSGNTEESAKTVLTSVLPLLGSWVGTILAFYFSKENFEAATRSVTELAKQITPQEKLQSTPVRDKMIRKNQMH